MIKDKLIIDRTAQRLLKGLAAGVAVAAGLYLVAQVRLKNPGGADRQKVFINNRLCDDPAAFNQRLRIVTRTKRLTVRFAGGRQAIAKVRQPLLTQQEFAVRERTKHLLQMTLMGEIIFAHPRLAKQSVVQGAALRR